MTARHVLEFTRSAEADRGAAQLPEGDVEYQLRADGQQRPDLAVLRWSPRLAGLLDALRDQGEEGAGEAAARVGRVLADFVATPGWAIAAHAIAADVERGLTALTIRSNASELYLLPWELLALGAVAHAAFLPALLVRYEWPDAPAAPRLPGLSLTRRGRVVFAWSAAGGKVDAARHVKLIERALDAGAAAFDEERGRSFDVVDNASCESLRAALERAKAAGDPVAVLHLLCHGGRRAEGSFSLCLDADDAPGEVDLVSASRMQQLLVPYAGLVRLVVVAACDGGNAGAAGHELGSVAQCLHRAGMPAVVASRFPLSWDGARLFATELYDRMARDLGTLEEAFLAARARLSRRPAVDWASLQLYARASDGEATRAFTARPYRGLAAFGPEHARFFFGRDAEVAEVVSDLDALVAKGRSRLLVVAGASGTGKSSMVMGGALPRWARGQTDGAFGHVVVRPGGDLEGCLRRIEAKREVAAACARFVVVVDQFEEVFTHVGDPAARTAFARALWDIASEPDASVCVVLTLRVDFLARCGEIVLDESGLRLDRLACDPAHQILVAQMTPAQLREAIERPAAAVGLALEPNLAELIVRDVEAEPGALPLMSHALYLLWLGREGPTLSRAAYLRLGSVQGALNTHADAQVEALADDAAREVARRLLVRLVRPGEGGAADTRRRRAVDALRPGEEGEGRRFDAVLERLVGARLLVTSEGDGGARMVEIAHEALIRGWARLRGWVDGERVKLAQLDQLDVWVSDWKRTPDALLAGARLGYAEEVARQHEAELSAEARRLVAESVAARGRAQAQRDRARRAQWAAAAGVGLVLAGFAVFAGAQWRAARASEGQATAASGRANEEARNARVLSEIARASELRTRLESGGGTEREVLAAALVLWDEARGAAAQRRLLRVLRRAAGDVGESARTRAMRPLTPDVGGTLTQAVLEARQTMQLRGHNAAVRSAQWTADGRRLVTADTSSVVRVWDAATGEPMATLRSGAGDNYDPRALVTPGGQHVVVATRDHVYVWRGHGRDYADASRFLEGEPVSAHTHLTMSPDGHRLLGQIFSESDQKFRLRSWSCPEGEALADVEIPERDPVHSIQLSRDGGVALVTSDGAPPRFWRVGERRLTTLPGDGGRSGARATLSLGATRAATAIEGTVTLWDLTTGRSLRSHRWGGVATAMQFAEDGSTLVLGFENVGEGSRVRAWRLPDGPQVGLGDGFPTVQSLRLSGDGGRLATRHVGGTVAVWDLPSETLMLVLRPSIVSATDVAMSPDGERAVVVVDRTATVWTLRASDPMFAPLDVGGAADSAKFSRDGWQLRVDVRDGGVRLWSLNGPARAVALPNPTARPGWTTWFLPDRAPQTQIEFGSAFWYRPFALSPDGARVAYLNDDDALTLVGPSGAGAAPPSVVLPERARSVAFSPDSTQVLAGDEGGVVHVLDAHTRRPLRALRGHAEAVTALAFSGNGRLLATASHDGAVCLWNASDGAQRLCLHAHDGEVRALAFSREGDRLLTSGEDGTATAWRADDGRPLLRLRWRGERVRDARISPDGRFAAVVYAEGAAELVDLDPVVAWRSGCALLRDGPLWRERPRLRDACAGVAP